MNWTKPSLKQTAAMGWWTQNKEYEGIIADGSIRAGKTLALSVGFVLWAMDSFENCNFAICGKTVSSCRKNVIDPLVVALMGRYSVQYKHTENCMYIGTNKFYVYGGRDESSQSLIQGITLAGVLLDEVALMPESFVNQATGRCSVDGSKYWFNCNPESPQHWFYTKWIKRAKSRKLLHLHFTMDDNPSLTEHIKQRYTAMYDGVFYDRFIRGLWVIAEGLIYDFQANIHTTDAEPAADTGTWWISMDYGTQNPCSMGLWNVQGDKTIRVDEYYYSGRDKGIQKTDEEYYTELEKLVGNRPIEAVVIDPSAASFIATVNKYGKFRVRKAKNDVLDGIRVTAAMLKAGRILIHQRCKSSISEFGLYSWDDKAKEDKPLKESDHAMDEIRYFCYTVLRRLWRVRDERGD